MAISTFGCRVPPPPFVFFFEAELSEPAYKYILTTCERGLHNLKEGSHEITGSGFAQVKSAMDDINQVGLGNGYWTGFLFWDTGALFW